MQQLLATQYAMVQSARSALFDYCETLAAADLVVPLSAFNNNSLRDLLVHIANAYRHWLGIVAQGQPRSYYEPSKIADLLAVRQLFQEIDVLAGGFITHVGTDWQRPSTFVVPGRPTPLQLTPLEIFTHVITHEFHHKGQLLSMSRQLGYTPVDTDIIRT